MNERLVELIATANELGYRVRYVAEDIIEMGFAESGHLVDVTVHTSDLTPERLRAVLRPVPTITKVEVQG